MGVMRKWVLGLAVVAVVLAAVVHWTRLDSLAWYAVKIALLPETALEEAIGLKNYRVDIEGRPLVGIDDDVSALTYNPGRNTLFTVLNNEPVVVELTLEGRVLRQLQVVGAQDLEGLTYVAGNRYVIAEERKQRLWVVRIDDDTTAIALDRAPGLTVALDVFKNRGFEGLSYHEASGHLLLLSDRSKLVVEYDADGNPISMLPLWRGFRGLTASVPQAEGVALDSEGRLYIVSEPNLFYRFSRN